MKFIITIAFIACLITLASCSNIKSSDFLNLSLSSSHYDTKRDIAYGQNTRQKLDIYYPNKSVSSTLGKDKPVIVFVLGGAWRKGDKEDFKFIGHAFTQAGYRVVIPNYRLYPEVRYPDFVDDVADAIAHIEKNAGQLIDLSQGIVLMGHSAGAHTVASLVTDQAYFNNRQIKTPLKALIAISGPYDLNLEDPEVRPIFRDYTNRDSRAKPTRMVQSNMPPVLLLHGVKDKRVKFFHTERFASALQQAGVEHEVKLYNGVKHVQIIISIAKPLRYLNPSYQDILTFLSKIKQ